MTKLSNWNNTRMWCSEKLLFEHRLWKRHYSRWGYKQHMYTLKTPAETNQDLCAAVTHLRVLSKALNRDPSSHPRTLWTQRNTGERQHLCSLSQSADLQPAEQVFVKWGHAHTQTHTHSFFLFPFIVLSVWLPAQRAETRKFHVKRFLNNLNCVCGCVLVYECVILSGFFSVVALLELNDAQIKKIKKTDSSKWLNVSLTSDLAVILAYSVNVEAHGGSAFHTAGAER